MRKGLPHERRHLEKQARLLPYQVLGFKGLSSNPWMLHAMQLGLFPLFTCAAWYTLLYKAVPLPRAGHLYTMPVKATLGCRSSNHTQLSFQHSSIGSAGCVVLIALTLGGVCERRCSCGPGRRCGST